MIHKGEILKKVIEAKGLTVTSAAPIIGWTRTYLQNLVGKANFTEPTIKTICKKLGVDKKVFYPEDSGAGNITLDLLPSYLSDLKRAIEGLNKRVALLEFEEKKRHVREVRMTRIEAESYAMQQQESLYVNPAGLNGHQNPVKNPVKKPPKAVKKAKRTP